MDRFCCTVPLDDLESTKDRLTANEEEGDVYFKQMANVSFLRILLFIISSL